MLALGDREGLGLLDGLREGLGEMDADAELDGLRLALGDTLGEGLELGESEGETDGLGLTLGLPSAERARKLSTWYPVAKWLLEAR